MRKSCFISLTPGLPFLAINFAKSLCKESERLLKDTERLKRNHVPSGSQEVMVQLNLARKFTVWGLFSIFDLIYSCVIISDSSGSAYVGQGFIDIDVHPSTLQEKEKRREKRESRADRLVEGPNKRAESDLVRGHECGCERGQEGKCFKGPFAPSNDEEYVWELSYRFRCPSPWSSWYRPGLTSLETRHAKSSSSLLLFAWQTRNCFIRKTLSARKLPGRSFCGEAQMSLRFPSEMLPPLGSRSVC